MMTIDVIIITWRVVCLRGAQILQDAINFTKMTLKVKGQGQMQQALLGL